jgi:hypothetical protein
VRIADLDDAVALRNYLRNTEGLLRRAQIGLIDVELDGKGDLFSYISGEPIRRAIVAEVERQRAEWRAAQRTGSDGAMSARGISMAELFGGMAEERPRAQRPMHEAQVSELLAMSQHYSTPAAARFKPGDLATPACSSRYGQKGEPHVVLEALQRPLPPAAPQNQEDEQSPYYRGRLDMRVAILVENSDGMFVTGTYWVESWMFVEWRSKTISDSAY